MIRYRYNQQVSPPAPFVLVGIRRPDGATHADNVPAQLDWGSDVTVIPGRLVAELGLEQFDEQPTLGFGGHVVLAAPKLQNASQIVRQIPFTPPLTM